MPEDLGDKEIAEGVDRLSFIIPVPKIGNLKQCQNYSTIA